MATFPAINAVHGESNVMGFLSDMANVVAFSLANTTNGA